MNTSKIQIAYLILAVIGTLGTMSFFVQYVQANGFNIPGMLADSLTNDASKFAAVEIGVAALVYLIWMLNEARKLGMKYYWVYVAIIFCPTFAVSMPIFLFMRERKLQEIKFSAEDNRLIAA